MGKNCECYRPCSHEEQVEIKLSIPMSVYKTLKYRHAEDEELSIEEDIIQTLYDEDYFSGDMDSYAAYSECKRGSKCVRKWNHHHLLGRRSKG